MKLGGLIAVATQEQLHTKTVKPDPEGFLYSDPVGKRKESSRT